MVENDHRKQQKLDRLLKVNDIIYGQLGYADVKLSFLLAANIGLIVGTFSGILDCLFNLVEPDDPSFHSILPWWGFLIIVACLTYVFIVNIVSTIFTVQGLSPNTQTHGFWKKDGKKIDAKEDVPNNQFFFGDLEKYHVDFLPEKNKTILGLRRELLDYIDSRGIDGAIEDAVGQNIAVSHIIMYKYAKTKTSVYFLLASLFLPWYFLGKSRAESKVKSHQ